MTNWTELKLLAEEATGGDWEFRLGLIRTDADSDGYVPIAVAPNSPKYWRNQRDLNMQFIAAANPKTILALIAENERLSQDIRMLVRQHMPLDALEGMPGWSEVVEARKAVEQRDQLRAEVEELRKECSALAAGACDGVIGDDYGNAFCKYKVLLSECKRWVALAYDQGFEGVEELGKRIDSALKANR